MTDHELPKFDLPVDFVATDEIPVTLLQNHPDAAIFANATASALPF